MNLWNYFDGEPFLENPGVPLGIASLNPRPKRRKTSKKGKKMAARRRKRVYRRRHVKRTPARRRRTRRSRARRNAFPIAGVAINPRRRRRSRRTVNARRRRRSSYRRNPSLSLLGVGIPPLNKVIFAGVGFIAPPMVEGFLSQFLPTSITSNSIGKYVTRILSVVGLSFLTRKFVGVEEGNMVAIGGSVYILSTAVSEFAPGVIPGLGMYVPARNNMRAYVPATTPTSQPIGNVVGLPAQIPQPSRFNRLTR